MKNKGGRPRRFKDQGESFSFQLSADLAHLYRQSAKAKGLSLSQFGESVFRFWLEEKIQGDQHGWWYQEEKNQDSQCLQDEKKPEA